ncbi:MAG: hypothetical protein H6R18_1904 [Proteobacteria bacterium]|nr:hypothetical protein [Pseudomonadota bacterium]
MTTETAMRKWRARSTTPVGIPVLVRYVNKWRGENFTEEFEAEFDGHDFWQRGCTPKKSDNGHCTIRTRVINGDFQRAVYENGVRTAIIRWRHLPNARGNPPDRI